MTDQRQIDPSTLRDGEFQAGWDACLSAIKEQFGEDYSSTNRNPEWHVKMPDPVCPFPMGARVVDPFGAVEIVTDWRPTPGGLWLVYLGGRAAPYGWLPDALTLAPEPAPIEVGDWLESLMDKDLHVVTSVDGDWIGIRWWQSGDIYRVNRQSIEGWTRLDGPPEPPVGSVYVLVGIVWHHQAEGHVPASPVRVNGPWAGIRTWKEQRSLYNVRQLATLQIVHTLGAE